MRTWVVREMGSAMLALCPAKGSRGLYGRYIKASGSTVTMGRYDTEAGGPVYTVNWGMSLLGKTQVKINEEWAKPTDRLAEFVLDCIGAIEYKRAKKRTRPYSKG